MKLWNMIALMTGMMLFLALLGFEMGISNTVLGDMGINISAETGNKIDIASSSWQDKLFNPTTGILIGLGIALAIGFLTKTFDWKLALLGFFTAYVVTFLGFAKSIFELVPEGSTWLRSIVIMVFGLISAMFIFSIIEWFGGSPAD